VFLTLLVALEVVGPYLFGFESINISFPAQMVHFRQQVQYAHQPVSLDFSRLATELRRAISTVRIMQMASRLFTTCAKKSSSAYSAPDEFFDRTPVGRLVTRVTTISDALNDLFAAVSRPWPTTHRAAVHRAVMMWMNWRLRWLHSRCFR